MAGIELRGNLQNGEGGDASYVADYQRMLAFLQRGSVGSLILPQTTDLIDTLTAKLTALAGADSIPVKATASTPTLSIDARRAPLDDSQYHINLRVTGDGRYQVERSSDLETWTTSVPWTALRRRPTSGSRRWIHRYSTASSRSRRLFGALVHWRGSPGFIT